MALGDALSEERDMDEIDGGDLDDEEDPAQDDSGVILAHFCNAGLIYTEEGDENWVLFLAQTLNSKIKLTEIRKNGIVITWHASPPSDSDIISVQEITSLRAAEMNLRASRCSLFIASPRPISQDSSKMKKGPSPQPPETASWLVITIPFEKDNEDLNVEMSPLRLQKN